MDNIIIKLQDLPHRVHGLTAKTYCDGEPFYTVILNSRDTLETNQRTYLHEVAHIYSEDFDSYDSLENIESIRHKR